MSSTDFRCAENCANDEKCEVCGPCGQRSDELAFKRGFDAGVAHQKTAEPPPKAKQYRDERDRARKALVDLIAGQSHCGDPNAECPLQDAGKPWHDAQIAITGVKP